MHEIWLTKGQKAIIDDQDFDLTLLKWSVVVAGSHRNCYATRKTSRADGHTTQLMHRVILERKLGRPLLREEFCDHIDGNGLNNRRDNLRVTTNSQNQQNYVLPRNNKSGQRGVCWKKARQKWAAYIQINWKNNSLGYFDTLEDAIAARRKAELQYYGEFSPLVSREDHS